MWIFYVIIYACIIGFFSVYRKKAAQESNFLFVLALSSTVGFLLIGWNFQQAWMLDQKYILLILCKSFVVSLSWVFELYAVKNYFISALQPLSSIKVVFGFFASMLIFSEETFWWQFIGVAIVGVGLFALNKEPKSSKNKYNDGTYKTKQKYKSILFFVLACLCSETSAIFDKYIMQYALPNQMQWWYMLFISVIVWIYFLVQCLINKKMLISKKDFKNFYIYIVAILLILADQLLFKSLTDPASKASIVSVLKQISTIVSVIYGAYFFKEPNLKRKLTYLGIILCGIIIILL